MPRVAYICPAKANLAPAAKEEAQEACITALDIGADSSNLVITDADRIICKGRFRSAATTSRGRLYQRPKDLREGDTSKEQD